MLINIPYLHCYVQNSFIKNSDGFTEVYLFAATILHNRPLLFTAHTIDGAVFSRLPIHGFLTSPKIPFPAFSKEEIDPWGCSGSSGNAIIMNYLKDYCVDIASLGIKGRYLFSIDYDEPGTFSEDPEQHKVSNVIALDNGQIAILPNNQILFNDCHFTNEKCDLVSYKRNKEYFLSNG